MDEKIESDGTFSVFFNLEKGHELRCRLSHIANDLKLYDKISVIFLLCKDPKEGIEIMKLLFEELNMRKQNYLFYKWMEKLSLFTKPNWKDCLAEVLTIIQNFRLAETLEFSKEDLKRKFEPKNNFKTLRVSAVHKTLYNLCEELTQEERTQLKSLINISNTATSVINKSENFLEFCLLSWNEKKIINLRDSEIDLNVLIKCLKDLGLNKFVNQISIIAEKSNRQIIRNKLCLKEETGLFEFYQIIDQNAVGLCVIISQKNFSNCLFPKRWGTDKDVERLVEVFTAFGFTIQIYVDLTYEVLKNTLTDCARTINDNLSFFVLIILSHGSENVIYTSDSLPVDINAIEMMFQAESCPKLIGKPKIFIIQSCQGDKWQKVLASYDESEICTDNFVYSKSNQPIPKGPQRGDSLIAWSTVQGFASFRDKYNGSWYIQELCKELWKFGDVFDLVEIFTRLNNNLRSKVHDGQFMVPSLLLSLRARVKFPQLKKNLLKAKKLMLERLLFEKYLKEFLMTNGSLYINRVIKGC